MSEPKVKRDTSILASPNEIRAAAARIAPVVRQTPFYKSETLSAFVGGDVWLKMESEQHTGSFKLRGATNAIALLTAEQRAAGVVTASAGNHGLGIAHAAQAAGVKLTVFLPRTAPSVKKDRIAGFGATVDATAPNYDAAELLAKEFAHRNGATFVSAYAGREILAGQGTVGLEILDALPTLRTIIIPIGGVGLASGIAGLLRAEAPAVRIIGAQSDRTNAMTIAMRTGKPAVIPDLPTLADGLSGQADEYMLAQGQAALDEMVVSSEEDVASAIAYVWIEEGFRVEGAGAVGVAALIAGRVPDLQFPVVVVVSGGNIDEAKHKAVLAGRAYDE